MADLIPNKKIGLVVLNLIVFMTLLFYSESTPLWDEEDKDILFIKMAVARIPVASFTAFPGLIQELQGDVTVYKDIPLGTQSKGRVIYERDSNDVGQHLIILTEDEDRLDFTVKGEDNRIYMVMIQNPVDGYIYHACYAYARNVPPAEQADESVVTINRERRRIEWDVWDERGTKRNLAAAFGWATCLESFFVPCKQILPEYEDVEESTTSPVSPKQGDRVTFKTEDGLDAGENFDFFGDLDDPNHYCGFVGQVTDTIVEAVQFFSDLINGKQDGTVIDSRLDIRTSQDIMKYPASRNFMKLLFKEVKSIGVYTLLEEPSSILVARHLSEGYRVLAGLLNNTISTKPAENFTITIFTDQNDNQESSGKQIISFPDNSLIEKREAPREKRQDESTQVDPKRNVTKSVNTFTSSSSSSTSSVATSTSAKKTVKKTVTKSKRDVDEDRLRRETEKGGENLKEFCALPDLSEGDKTYCNCRMGKEFSLGITDGLGDSLSILIATDTGSDNPTVIDDAFNSLLPYVFCGTIGKTINLINGIIEHEIGEDTSPTDAPPSSNTGLLLARLAHHGIKMATKALGTDVTNGIESKPAQEVSSDVDLFSRIGWKTQDINDLEEFSSLDSELPFIGIGSCPTIPVNNEEILETDNINDLTRLYHTVLKTQCLEKQADLMSDMISEGHFVMNGDKTISISDGCPMLKKPLLSEREIDRLSLAFSITVFSQTYMDDLQLVNYSYINPRGDPVSRSAAVVMKFALDSLQEFFKMARIHLVKLARDLVRTIKSIFAKSLQDYFRFQHCAHCDPKFKEEAFNDCLTLLGIVQFVIEGLGPIETNGRTVSETWESFFNLNHDPLALKLGYYI